MKSMWTLFKSVRFTAFLLVLLTLFFIIGLIVPQADLVGPVIYRQWKSDHSGITAVLEGLQLTRIYTSVAMITLWGLFFLNLAVVLLSRLPAIFSRCAVPQPPEAMADVTKNRSECIDGDRLNDLAGVLKRKKYRVVKGDASLIAVKNRFAPLATLFFHVAFYLLFLGGMIAFFTRFRAEADIAVGETFNGAYTKIIKRPRIGSIPAANFSISQVIPQYYDRRITVGLKVVVNGPDGEKVAEINRPYRQGRLSFLVNDIDIAPLFTLHDTSGREVDGAYVKLKVLKGGADSFQIAGYSVTSRFLTDIDDSSSSHFETANLPQALKQTPEEISVTQDPEVVKPACEVVVRSGNEVVASGILLPGQGLSFRGQRLVFSDWTYWVHFYARSERGLGLIFATFAMMTAALIIRFGFHRRQIEAVFVDGGTYIWGSAEYFPVQFQEELVNVMRQTGEE